MSEGATAIFTVTAANPSPATNLSVKLTVEESSGAGQDFVTPEDEGTKTVLIQSGQTSAIYGVSSVNDLTDEPNGLVTVTLRDPGASEYKKGPTTSAAITVKDNDSTLV